MRRELVQLKFEGLGGRRSVDAQQAFLIISH